MLPHTRERVTHPKRNRKNTLLIQSEITHSNEETYQ